MPEEKKIEYGLVEGTATYIVKDFDAVKARAHEFVAEAHVEQVLETEADFKAYKKRRSAINKRKKELTQARIAMGEAILGTFNEQFKELEEILSDADRKMKETVDAWTESHKEPEPETPPAPPVYTLTISSGSKTIIEKIRKYAAKESDLTIAASYQIEETHNG